MDVFVNIDTKTLDNEPIRMISRSPQCLISVLNVIRIIDKSFVKNPEVPSKNSEVLSKNLHESRER